jgi:predicted nucleic acid-binding protein
MDDFVIDVSACMPWCCEDEATPESEETLTLAIAGSTLHAPSLWPWEMMNAVAVAVRRGRIAPDGARRFFEQIATFKFRIAPPPTVAEFERLSLLAARFRLTAYDSAYLDLAKTLGLTLVTLDDDLRKAAFADGVPIR